MSTSKVTRNYQITLPSELRILQNIQVGDTVVFTYEEGKVNLFKKKEHNLDRAFGIWKKGPSGEKEVRKMRQEWNTREQAD